MNSACCTYFSYFYFKFDHRMSVLVLLLLLLLPQALCKKAFLEVPPYDINKNNFNVIGCCSDHQIPQYCMQMCDGITQSFSSREICRGAYESIRQTCFSKLQKSIPTSDDTGSLVSGQRNYSPSPIQVTNPLGDLSKPPEGETDWVKIVQETSPYNAKSWYEQNNIQNYWPADDPQTQKDAQGSSNFCRTMKVQINTLIVYLLEFSILFISRLSWLWQTSVVYQRDVFWMLHAKLCCWLSKVSVCL